TAFVSPDDLPFLPVPDTAPTEIYPLSLHDALPIFGGLVPTRQRKLGLGRQRKYQQPRGLPIWLLHLQNPADRRFGLCQTLLYHRSEEHTSELQSRENLVCRLLLEKKKTSDGSERRI